jgi:ribose 5-phosphate isomerase A
MFVRALAERVADGLDIKAIPTSRKTEELARDLSIPMTSLEDVDHIDIDVDGADEVSPSLDLIKGHGGALLRERIIASVSSLFVVLVGEEKLVDALGTRVDLPVEVVPFGVPVVRKYLETIHQGVRVKTEGDGLFLTDNGNAIINVTTGAITDPAGLERTLDGTPGVVDNGLFVEMADRVLVQTEKGVQRFERKNTSREDAKQGPPMSGDC